METVIEPVRIGDKTMAEGDLYAILAPLWWTVVTNDSGQKYIESLAPFSREQRWLFAILSYIAEVDNVGHAQFYFNSTRIVWKDVLIGFKELGIYEGAEIVEELVHRMDETLGSDANTRQDQLDKYERNFDDVDNRLHSLEASTSEVLRQYVIQHRSVFYFDGDLRKLKPN